MERGDRVQINAPKSVPHPLSGLDLAFQGQRGTIIDIERGRPTMYRVKLDAPVFIADIGTVRDDLWCREYLRKERG